ncbi:MAG: hypothetical protein M1401_07325 [Chloroflexi bacterium]|nr:hypothetical protein [Chloroflexota bacterium]
MRTKKKLLIAGAGALLLALLVAGAAFAQTAPTPSPTAQAQTNYGQYFLDRLAAALGVTRDQLNAAGQTAANDTIDKQQQDGKLTADQASQAKQRVAQNGGFPQALGLGGRGGERGDFGKGHEGFLGGGAYQEGVAKALGLTTAELQTQLKSGKTVADLATAKNVSADQVKAAVVTAESAQLDQAVAAGKLTAAQAQQRKDQLNNRPADQFLRMGWARGQHGRPCGTNRNPTPAGSATPAPKS